MSARETVLALLSDLGRRGIAVRVAEGSVAVRPASGLTVGDRRVVREYRAELLEVLARAGSWDGSAAARLMAEADGLVERLGVDGRNPVLIAAAERVTGAYATCNAEVLRFAVEEFITRVHDAAAAVRQKE